MEILNLLIISFELNMINKSDYFSLRLKVNEIANNLNGLKKSQMSK